MVVVEVRGGPAPDGLQDFGVVSGREGTNIRSSKGTIYYQGAASHSTSPKRSGDWQGGAICGG